jgi:hypothetical protein
MREAVRPCFAGDPFSGLDGANVEAFALLNLVFRRRRQWRPVVAMR